MVDLKIEVIRKNIAYSRKKWNIKEKAGGRIKRWEKRDQKKKRENGNKAFGKFRRYNVEGEWRYKDNLDDRGEDIKKGSRQEEKENRGIKIQW